MSSLLVQKYAPSVRVLHWLMAIMILGLIVSGLIMVGIPKSDPQHHMFFKFHKSLGITILFLAIVRLFVRVKHTVPALPTTISPRTQRLSHVAHWILYALMIVTPISGFLMSTWKGQPIAWFGIALPHLFNTDTIHAGIAEKLHHGAAYVLLALLCIHLSAVVFHFIKDRVNLIKRII